MKSATIDATSYLIASVMIWLYYRYVLTSDLSFLWQFTLLSLMTIGFEVIYRYSKKHRAATRCPLLRYYLISLCVMALALTSFSQTELQQLGFNFTPDEPQTIKQYLQLKSLFFAVGVIIFPRLLRSK